MENTDAGAGMISASHAARAIGKSRESIVRALQTGDLEGVNFQGRWFVNEDSLPSWNPRSPGRPPRGASQPLLARVERLEQEVRRLGELLVAMKAHTEGNDGLTSE